MDKTWTCPNLYKLRWNFIELYVFFEAWQLTCSPSAFYVNKPLPEDNSFLKVIPWKSLTGICMNTVQSSQLLSVSEMKNSLKCLQIQYVEVMWSKREQIVTFLTNSVKLTTSFPPTELILHICISHVCKHT